MTTRPKRTVKNEMKKTLRPFQIEGAKFLSERYHALLADEMGLGKTVTALAAVSSLGLKNVLVVCPASVRSNWKQEIEECGVLDPHFDIISYNGAAAGDIPLRSGYDALILDEAHALKTPTSLRCQAIFGNGTGLARRAKYKWCLTGTPVLNRPRELYPILKCLHSGGIAPYNTWDKFAQRFCGAFFDGYSINTKGASHLEDLRNRLDGFMLRREKKDVLKELPPRIISHPPIDISTSELSPILELEEEIGNREAYLSPTHEDFAQLGDMARLLKVTGVAKVPAVSRFIEDILETEGKIVVFARHRDVIAALSLTLKKFNPVEYVGGMSDDQKKNVVSRFVRDEECRVFIGQIQAAGTGINGLQTVCHNVCFAELSWVPGEMAQAIDRCHRIGLPGSVEGVNVYMPHVPGTLESAMLQVQLGKGKVIEALVGSRSPEENVLEGLV